MLFTFSMLLALNHAIYKITIKASIFYSTQPALPAHS